MNENNLNHGRQEQDIYLDENRGGIFVQKVLDAAKQHQVSVAMSLMCALGVASMATQKSFKVARPEGVITPTSLYVMVLAEPGERKTTLLNAYLKGFGEAIK